MKREGKARANLLAAQEAHSQLVEWIPEAGRKDYLIEVSDRNELFVLGPGNGLALGL